jgi:hypothetical protein
VCFPAYQVVLGFVVMFFILGAGPFPCLLWPCKCGKWLICKPLSCCCPKCSEKHGTADESSESSLDDDAEFMHGQTSRHRKKHVSSRKVVEL